METLEILEMLRVSKYNFYYTTISYVVICRVLKLIAMIIYHVHMNRIYVKMIKIEKTKKKL